MSIQWRFFIVTLYSYDIYVIHRLRSLLIAKYMHFSYYNLNMIYGLFKTI